MKKILMCLLLTFTITLCVTAVSIAASISVSGETVSSYAGENVSISFTTSGVSSSNQLGAFEAVLGSLPSGVNLNNMTSSLGSSQNGAVSWFTSDPISGHSSNVTVRLSLNISASVNPGSYNIPVQFEMGDMDGNTYSRSISATLKIVERPTEQPEQPSEPEQPSTPSTPTVVKSSDAGLSSLTAQANGKSLDVSQNSTKYTATVEADVTAVTFTVKANSSSASIDSNKSTSGIGFVKNSGSGSQKTYTMSSLKEGINVIRITITAEDGTERNYTFTVTKKVTENNIETSLLPNIVEDVPPTEENTEEQENTEEKTEEVGFGLKTLIITGVEISPEFNTSTYEYTAIIEGSDSVEVIALPTEEGATVEIVGNTNLVSGENLITVLVKKDDEVKTYQIILTKTDATPTSTETTDDNTIFLGLTWKHIAIIAAAVLVLIAIVIKLVFLSKTTVEDDEPYDYGKKEKKEKKKNNKDVSDNIYYNDENSKKGRRFK